MDWARILAYVTGTVDQKLLARNEYLAAENRIMKAQLNGRMKLSDAERGALGSQHPAAPRTAKRREFAGRSFPSAIISHDNCLRARSRALKRPRFAGFSLKAPDCVCPPNGRFRLSPAHSLQGSRLGEFSTEF